MLAVVPVKQNEIIHNWPMIKNDEVTITCWVLIFPQSEPPPYDVYFLSTVIQRMSSAFHEWQIDTAAATWCDSADGNLAVKLAGYIGLW